MSIGNRIKAARKAAGLSQEELARRADLSLNGFADIEREIIKDPHYSSLRKIADALGVPIGKLLEAEPVPLAEAPEAGPVTKHSSPSPSSSEPEKVSEEERRFRVRGWEVILEDLATRYQEAEGELFDTDPNVYPNKVIDVAVLANYQLEHLSREANEVREAPGVIAAAEKVRSAVASMERILNDPQYEEHAEQNARFKKPARDAEASLSSIEEDRDERRGVS